MRLLPLYLLILAMSLAASEPAPPPAYPLWDGSESVADYAQRVNLPPTQSLDLGGGVKLDLVLIPAGQFIMGTPEPPPVDEDGFRKKIVTGQALLAASATALLVMLAVVIVRAIRKKRRPQLSLGLLLLVTVAAGGAVLSSVHWRQSARKVETARLEYAAAKARFEAAGNDEKPGHTVTLTKPFYMSKFAVTQEQYQQIAGANRSSFNGKDNPVEQVSWDDAQAFCKKSTEQTKEAVRLPTEAEWEFACRAGTASTYYSGDTEADLARVAWYSGNSKSTTHPVGQKEANAFGLYDMHGNVWQWCEDWYAEDYYGNSPAENPDGPAHGAYRVLRGGSLFIIPLHCRSAVRYGIDPVYRYDFIGFRIALAPVSRTP